MTETSTFESRTARVECSAEELYRFLTDIRNFEQFIPAGRFSDINIGRDTCTFSVNMLGKVNLKIGEQKEFSEVVYRGNAMQVNDFSLAVNFSDKGSGQSEVRLAVQASLNPFLKMLAAEPVKNFLETLVDEMEKFRGWKDIRKDI
jgi:carbon monoxide dehydrogenase subunit G